MNADYHTLPTESFKPEIGVEYGELTTPTFVNPPLLDLETVIDKDYMRIDGSALGTIDEIIVPSDINIFKKNKYSYVP